MTLPSISQVSDFRGLCSITDMLNTVEFSTSTNPPSDGVSYASKITLNTIHPATGNWSRHQFMGRQGQAVQFSGELNFWTSQTNNAESLIKQLEYWYTHGKTIYYVDDEIIQDVRVFRGATAAGATEVTDYARGSGLNDCILSDGVVSIGDKIWIACPYPFWAFYLSLSQIGNAAQTFDWYGYIGGAGKWTKFNNITGTHLGLKDLAYATDPGWLYWPDSDWDGIYAEDIDTGEIPPTVMHDQFWLKGICTGNGNAQLKANELYVVKRAIITDFNHDTPIARAPWTKRFDLTLEDT